LDFLLKNVNFRKRANNHNPTYLAELFSPVLKRAQINVILADNVRILC